MKMPYVIEHPLIQHKLAILRDEKTPHMAFRRLVREITGFMLYEVMKDYPLKEETIRTPLEETQVKKLAREITIVLILRAGLGMMPGVHDLVPETRVGYVGLFRNEETLEPVEYYAKFPPSMPHTEVIVVDPMLATGGSAAYAVTLIKQKGAEHIKFVSIVAAPEGVKTLHEAHPDVPIYTAALDRELNENGYILPGLGDAGDRLFGTK